MCRTAGRSQFEDALDILGIQGSSAESSWGEGLQTSLLEARVPLCCLLRQPTARRRPWAAESGAGVRQAPLQAPVVLSCCQWGLKVEVWGIF